MDGCQKLSAAFCIQGSWEAQLNTFLAGEIETDPCVVNGAGFREAHAAFKKCNCPVSQFVNHVHRTGAFPQATQAA